MYEKIQIALIIITIIFFLVSLPFILVDYQKRMKVINHHYCVEVYGLDENCK